MSLALAAPLLALLPLAGQAGARWTDPLLATPAAEELVRTLRLQRAADAPPEAELLALLAPPLAGGLAPVLDVLHARRLPALAEGDVEQVLNVYQESLALDALAALDAGAVRAGVGQWLGEGREPRELAVAVRALGAGGAAKDLAQLVAWTAPAEREDELHPALAPALRDGLARLVARDPATLDALSRGWRSYHPAQVGEAVQALGELGRPEGLRWYAEVLALSPDHGPSVLAQVVRLAPSPWPSVDAELANLVRPWLDVEAPVRCQSAARALGALDDVDSVASLIELLAVGGPIAQSAHWALQRITGLPFPNQAVVWSDWYRIEERFERTELPGLLEDLRDRRPERLGRALRELPQHPLLRHRLVPELDPLLAHREAWVRRRACQGLAKLRSPLAVPALAGRLADPDAEVVAAAHAALVGITGAELPPEPYPWRELVADTRWGS